MNSRIQRVLDKMKGMGLDQMMVSDPKSIWYLTGVDVEPHERLFAFLTSFVQIDMSLNVFIQNKSSRVICLRNDC